MNLFKLLLAIAVLYMGQSYYLMTDGHVNDFLIEHNLQAMNDPVGACDNFNDDVEVLINHESGAGTWEVEGGKSQLCGYLKQSQAALVMTQANTTSRFDNMDVTSNFPWQTATAEYDEISTISMQGMSTMDAKTHETIKLKRTLTGLQITSISSIGGIDY